MLAFHLEDELHGARERYHLDRLWDEDGYCAGVLREDALRVRRVLRAMERFVVRMPACAERDALAAVPQAARARRSARGVELLLVDLWRDYPCAHPDIVLGFFFLLKPGGLSRDLAELQLRYAELESILMPEA
jgi:hypothetical protein